MKQPPAFPPLAQRGTATKQLHKPTPAKWWPNDTASLVVLASLLAVVLERMASLAGDLHLYADGSWWLVRIASTRSWYFWIADWHRQWFQSRAFTILAEQTPVVLATRLGVHSLHALSLIFGATLYSHALISLYICYRYTARRWYLLFPLLSLYAGSMNVEALQVSDSHFALSLYWPVLFILLFREELKGATRILLLALSIPLVLTYESTLFFGVILAGVCIWRIKKYSHARAFTAGVAVWYLVCAGVAATAILIPFDPRNKSGFVNGLMGVLHSDHLGAKVSVLVLLSCALLLLTTVNYSRVQNLLAVVGIAAVLYEVFRVLVGKAPVTLDSQVGARSLNLLVPLAVTGLLLFVLVGLLQPDRRAIQLVAVLVGALGIGQAFYGIGCLIRWQGMLATLRYELMLHEGPIPFGSSVMSRDQLGPLHLRDLHATWPLLPLSLYEAEHGDVKSILLTDPGGYLPFDPFAVSSFPDLARYGVHYDSYERALRQNWQYQLGETLTFPRGGSALQFLTGSWSTPEDWATWSESRDFGIKLPIRAGELPESVTLEAQVVPNLSENHANSSAEVLVNGEIVGRWNFRYVPQFEIRTVEARVPREVLAKRNPVEIQFHMLEPVLSPTEQGKATDPRNLALAFLKMRLYPAK